MSIRYIIGRAGSGKSTVCLNDIRERLRNHDEDHALILLVPEQSTFRLEHALAASPGVGGFMRAQVLSFRRLAFRVMQETGGTARVHISDTGKKMLLHRLLHRIKGEMKTYRLSAGQSGFIECLNEMLVEFKRYHIDAEKLAELLQRAQEGGCSPMLADKLHDLLLVCRDYEKEMAGLYVDAEDDLAMLAEKFGTSSYAGGAEVWIDGFNGFTPQEYTALAAILRHASRVNIALCVDRLYDAAEEPDELDLFHPTASALICLRRIAAEYGIREEPPLVLAEEPLPRFEASPMLACLERGLADRDTTSNPISYMREEVRIVSAGHRRAEAESVARRMLELTRDGASRWREMVVLVRNMEDYRDVLATTFGDYGIPHFFDQKRTVAHHPLLELIFASLETVGGGYRYDHLFRAVKSGMLVAASANGAGTQPCDAEQPSNLDLDRLENYVLAYGIRGSRWTDGLPWTFMPRSSLEEEPGNRTDKDNEILLRINEVRKRIVEPLGSLEAALKKAASVRDMVEAVYGLLVDTDAAGQLERMSADALNKGDAERAREHSGIWDGVIDVMDQLVEMMGDESLSLDEFTELFETGLSHLKLGLVPPALDQVLIGSMERTRTGSVKHVFILGANDGIMPAVMKEDGILSEQERDYLAASGLSLAPGSVRRLLDERFMIYTALAMPSESLWISYPLADDEGKALLPSEVIRRIRRLFPGVKPQYVSGDPPKGTNNAESAAYMIHPDAALSALTLQLKQAQRGMPIAEVWWQAYNWFVAREQWRDKLRFRINSLFLTNKEDRIQPATSRLLYGTPLIASISRMETFAACQFAHFSLYGLCLRDRRTYRLEAPDIGQLFHAALSGIGSGLRKEGIDWANLTDEQCVWWATAIVDQLIPRLQGEILLSTNRYRFIARKLNNIVARAAAVLAEHSRRSAFRPIGLEIGFGRNGELPPLVLGLDNGDEMEIAGRIDRVDLAEIGQEQWLRIIDYKSSQTGLNLTEAYYGLSLQMLTYLDVVVTHSARWLGQQAKPAGLLYFHVHEPLVRTDSPLGKEDAHTELFRKFKMKGLVLADESAVKLMDSSLESGYSSVIPVAVKSDGTFYKNSSVMTESQWKSLQKHGRTTIRKIGAEIAAGKVDIQPYRMGGQTPCAYCAYKSVCHFDPSMDGNAYSMKIPYKQEEVWGLLEARGGDSE